MVGINSDIPLSTPLLLSYFKRTIFSTYFSRSWPNLSLPMIPSNAGIIYSDLAETSVLDADVSEDQGMFCFFRFLFDLRNNFYWVFLRV
jgi:hypothetical protein